MGETVGNLADWQPRERPNRSELSGDLVQLEPLHAERHADALFAAASGPNSDPAMWDYLPYGPFANRQELSTYLQKHAASDDPLFFAIVDRATGRAAGVASFMRMAPADGVIEIGHIWFGAVLQRTPQATEAIYLLAKRAFDELGYRRLEWKCNAANQRSRRAAERFGFTYEGTFRQHMIVKGANRDTAWYSMLDGEWPEIRRGFERWLAPENFDVNGNQRASLAELRER